MKSDSIIEKMSKEKTYSREELQDLYNDEGFVVNDNALSWIIDSQLKDNKIYRISRNAYSISGYDNKIEYHPQYSDETIEITDQLQYRFPGLAFVAFESVLLNEFLNHLIAQNTIFLFISKEISSFVFDTLLKDYNKPTLYDPSVSELHRYWQKNCIIILNLISRSPLNRIDQHEITIEKLLVDIVAEKSIASVFSPAELSSIFELAQEKYLIDKKKLINYASRRNKTEEIKIYLKEN